MELLLIGLIFNETYGKIRLSASRGKNVLRG